MSKKNAEVIEQLDRGTGAGKLPKTLRGLVGVPTKTMHWLEDTNTRTFVYLLREAHDTLYHLDWKLNADMVKVAAIQRNDVLYGYALRISARHFIHRHCAESLTVLRRQDYQPTRDLPLQLLRFERDPKEGLVLAVSSHMLVATAMASQDFVPARS